MLSSRQAITLLKPLQVKYATLIYWANMQYVKAIKVGKLWRFPPEEIDKILRGELVIKDRR